MKKFKNEIRVPLLFGTAAATIGWSIGEMAQGQRRTPTPAEALFTEMYGPVPVEPNPLGTYGTVSATAFASQPLSNITLPTVP